MTARDVDLNRAVAGCGIGRTRGNRFFSSRPVNNLHGQKAWRLSNLFFNDLWIWSKLGITQPLWIKLVFMAYRRATCATDTPGAQVCAQIDTFSSSDQNRFF